MFGKRKGFGGRGPISTLMSGIATFSILCFIIYIAYNVIIVEDGISANSVANVFTGIVEWGISVGKGVADWIISLLGGSGGGEIVPEGTPATGGDSGA